MKPIKLTILALLGVLLLICSPSAFSADNGAMPPGCDAVASLTVSDVETAPVTVVAPVTSYGTLATMAAFLYHPYGLLHLSPLHRLLYGYNPLPDILTDGTQLAVKAYRSVFNRKDLLYFIGTDTTRIRHNSRYRCFARNHTHLLRNIIIKIP